MPSAEHREHRLARGSFKLMAWQQEEVFTSPASGKVLSLAYLCYLLNLHRSGMKSVVPLQLCFVEWNGDPSMWGFIVI